MCSLFLNLNRPRKWELQFDQVAHVKGHAKRDNVLVEGSGWRSASISLIYSLRSDLQWEGGPGLAIEGLSKLQTQGHHPLFVAFAPELEK